MDHPNTGKMMAKLNKLPEFSNRTLEYKQQWAAELTSPELLKQRFSHLLDAGNRFMTEISRDENTPFANSIQRRDHHQKMKQKIATACNFPIRLSLQRIPEEKLPLAHTFTSLLKFEYGPLHAALIISDVTIEWGRSGIAEPRFEPRTEAYFQALVGDDGEWKTKENNFIRQMSMANRNGSSVEKLEVLHRSMAEKTEMINRLVEVIATYNRQKEYNVFTCNCQHFARDAMAALGIVKPVRFEGLLQQRFEQLKRGKVRVPKELKTHENLDTYVTAFMHELDRPDMEYLQCLYFSFHLPAIEESEDRENWKCTIPTCMSTELDRAISDSSIALKPSQIASQTQAPDVKATNDTIQAPNEPVVEEQARNGTSQSSIEPAITVQTDNNNSQATNEPVEGQAKNGTGTNQTSVEPAGETQDENNAFNQIIVPEGMLGAALASPEKEIECSSTNMEIVDTEVTDDLHAVKCLEMSFPQQTKLVGTFRGYRDCVLCKYRSHQLYKSQEEDKMIEILTEREKLFEQYFNKFVSKSEECILAITNDQDTLETHTTSWMKLCQLTCKIIYRIDFKNHKVRKPACQTPLTTLLRVNNVNLEWTKAGLVVPVESIENSANLTTIDHILLVQDLSDTTDFSQQVKTLKQQMEMAIASKDVNTVILLMYEMAAILEKSIYSLLDVIVRFNRYSHYHKKACHHLHFAKEVLRGIGVADQSLPTTSLQQYCTSPSLFTPPVDKTITSHADLDAYVFENYDCHTTSTHEREYLISKYFIFHTENWKADCGKKDWTCTLDTCQLLCLL